MKGRFTSLSLFSGAGGIDLGFKLTDKFDIIFGNDISVSAVETYSHNFGAKLIKNPPMTADMPSVFLGSIEKIEFEDLSSDLDVITGGPPCQDFSIVRGPQKERGGIKVNRGKLYAHFIRALIHLQPKVFVFENVPGLMSTNDGEAYKAIINDFPSLNIRWHEIKKLVNNGSSTVPKNYEIVFAGKVDSSKLGVPQTRKRLIIVGLRKDLAQSVWWKIKKIKKRIENAFLGEGTLVSKYPLTSLEVFEGQPLSNLQKKYAEIMEEYRGLAEEIANPASIEWKKNTRAVEWERNTWGKLTFDVVKDYLNINRLESSSESEFDEACQEHKKILQELGYYGIRVQDVKSLDGSNKIRKTSESVIERMERIPPDENHEFVRNTTWEVEGKGMSLIYRRLHPLKPSYTVVAYGGGGTWGYHYERKRTILTNRERARIQTFPDNFHFEGNTSEVRAQIGEAVPPLMSKRIAKAVVRILEEVS